LNAVDAEIARLRSGGEFDVGEAVSFEAGPDLQKPLFDVQRLATASPLGLVTAFGFLAAFLAIGRRGRPVASPRT
jgi:hypothetical protein